MRIQDTNNRWQRPVGSGAAEEEYSAWFEWYALRR